MRPDSHRHRRCDRISIGIVDPEAQTWRPLLMRKARTHARTHASAHARTPLMRKAYHALAVVLFVPALAVEAELLRYSVINSAWCLVTLITRLYQVGQPSRSMWPLAWPV